VRRAIVPDSHAAIVARRAEQLRGTTFAWPGRAKQALAEHRTVVKAIERQDAPAAEKAARSHVHTALRLRLLMMRAATKAA